MHRVFIYGTLKRGFPNDITHMNDVRLVGRFRSVVAYTLVIGGKWFSPYLIAEPGEGYKVFGEVIEVDDRGLEKLDRMEGTHVANGYRRIRIAIEHGDDHAFFEAWTYVKARNAIEGIHSEPMEEYMLDPRYVIPANRTSDF